MKSFRNADKRQVILARCAKEQTETDRINMSFSSQQLTKLRALVEDCDEVAKHDAVCAYIILTVNKHLFQTIDIHMRHAYIVVNYRGVSDSLAPNGHD
jgi:hypothetical protein